MARINEYKDTEHFRTNTHNARCNNRDVKADGPIIRGSISHGLTAALMASPFPAKCVQFGHGSKKPI